MVIDASSYNELKSLYQANKTVLKNQQLQKLMQQTYLKKVHEKEMESENNGRFIKSQKTLSDAQRRKSYSKGDGSKATFVGKESEAFKPPESITSTEKDLNQVANDTSDSWDSVTGE